jgi:hypothetical protein
MSDWEDIAIGPSASAAPPIADDWQDVAMGAPADNSELRGVANRGLQGVSSFLSLVDQFNPIRSNPNSDIPLNVPPLFGLFNDTEAPIGQTFDAVTKNYGIQTEDQPQTIPGKVAGNVLENALAAVGFGPAAMAGNAVFGGGGASIGEAAFGEKGRMWGSLGGGLAPVGISKLGIVKEIGEQLGPTISQLPIMRDIFGNAPVQAAVGRALGKTSEDLPSVEKALREAGAFIGPPTKLNSLKTSAEIVGDSGIARAEDAIENMLPSAGFKNIAGERAAVRAEDVLEGFDPKVTTYETSKALESSVTKAIDNIEEVESAAWKALPKDAPVDTKLGTLADDLQTAIDDITFSGDVPVTGTAAALLKRANNLGTEGTTSFDSLQKLRSQSLTLARATAKGSDDAERVANQVSNAIANHLDDVIDANVASGNFPDDAANLWRESRALTKDKMATFGASRPGVQNTGTKALEQLGLKGQALDNTTLIREGLSSPDKLAAHIRAAAKGGQDVRPIYKQALQSELDGVSQTRWKDVISGKRNQWEQVFSKDEMAAIDRNLADIESEIAKGRLSTTTNSMTNPRGNAQKILNAEKGIAAFSTGLGNTATLGGAIAGAKTGWDSADTTAGGVLRGLLGAVVGGAAGKAGKGALIRASDKYDNVLTEALKNPGKMLEAIEAAKPSDIGKAVQSSIMGAGKAAGTTALGGALRSVMGTTNAPITDIYTGPNAEKNSQLKQSLSNVGIGGNEMPYAKEPVKNVIEAVKANPVDHAIALMESNLDPKAKNPDSTASGLFQLIKGTAKDLGVKDVFDPGENYDGYLKLKQSTIDKFGIEPDDYRSIYASHYLGENAFSKWLDGKPLSDTQQKQVNYLENTLFPKLDKFYAKAVGEAEDSLKKPDFADNAILRFAKNQSSDVMGELNKPNMIPTLYGEAPGPSLAEGGANVIEMAANMSPGLGDVLSAKDAVQDFKAGNYGMSALGALGAIPLVGAVGDAAKGVSKALDMSKAAREARAVEQGYLTTGKVKQLLEKEALSGLKAAKTPPSDLKIAIDRVLKDGANGDPESVAMMIANDSNLYKVLDKHSVEPYAAYIENKKLLTDIKGGTQYPNDAMEQLNKPVKEITHTGWPIETAWGESKDGDLLRLLHGTRSNDIKSFDPQYLGEGAGGASAKEAFFTSTSPLDSYSYATNMGPSVSVKRGLVPKEKLIDAISAKQKEADQIKLNLLTEEVGSQEKAKKLLGDLDHIFWKKNRVDYEDFYFNKLRKDPEYASVMQEANELNLKLADHSGYLNTPDSLATTYPLYVRSENPKIFNMKGAGAAELDLTAKIKAAKEGGHDSAILYDIKDPNNGATHVVPFNANQLRSIFAKFNPKDKESSDLLAGVLPLMALIAAQGGSERQ